jgi:chromosomal replication initiation ATPase DnaA
MQKALEIKSIIADYLNVSVKLMDTRSKKGPLVRARDLWAYFLRLEGYGDYQIIEIIKRDRTSLYALFDRVEYEVNNDKTMKRIFFELKDLIQYESEAETEEDLIDKEIEMLLGQI